MELTSLFEQMNAESEAKKLLESAPLARRMRPESFDEIVGQDGVCGPDSWLRRACKSSTLLSIILYGPPGCGKTTLAHIIARTADCAFCEVNAISGSVSDIRKEIDQAKTRLSDTGRKTILFVDEIHRFSKSQQDSLLHAVEDRIIILIGATTENPYFEVNSALLSRSVVLQLKAVDDDSISQVIDRAITSERGLNSKFSIDGSAVDEIVRIASGDVRFALNTLELASQVAEFEGSNKITFDAVRHVMPARSLKYDKHGDEHYDTISAFIKSMRGSDPSAALYWLAVMLESGEDPKFIARRIMVHASEDVGNADPNALLVAHAAFKACEVIGMPECRINLAQACTYVALAPKSNSASAGIDEALSFLRQNSAGRVPDHLRDRHRPGSEDYPEYLYPHSYDLGWVDQQYLPDVAVDQEFYKAGAHGWEADRSKALVDMFNKKV